MEEAAESSAALLSRAASAITLNITEPSGNLSAMFLGDEDHHLHFRKPCTKAHASSEGEGLLDPCLDRDG